MNFDNVNFELSEASREALEKSILDRWEDMMFEMYQRLSVEDFDLHYDVV